MSLFSIQSAIYSALNGNITASVFDHVPEDSPFPYVVIGEDLASEHDTDTEQGYETVLTFHIWSRYRGKLEVKRIDKEIYNILHRADLTIVGQYTINLMWESSEIILDSDGLTYHGITEYRLLSEQTAPEPLFLKGETGGVYVIET